MLTSEKAILGTIGTKAKNVLKPLSLGFLSGFSRVFKVLMPLPNLPMINALLKFIDPEAKVTDKALNVQKVDIGTSTGCQKRG